MLPGWPRSLRPHQLLHVNVTCVLGLEVLLLHLNLVRFELERLATLSQEDLWAPIRHFRRLDAWLVAQYLRLLHRLHEGVV